MEEREKQTDTQRGKDQVYETGTQIARSGNEWMQKQLNFFKNKSSVVFSA